MPTYDNSYLIPVVKTKTNEQNPKQNQMIQIHHNNFSQEQFIPPVGQAKPSFYALYDPSKDLNIPVSDGKGYIPNSGIPNYTTYPIHRKKEMFQAIRIPWTTLPQRVVKGVQNKIVIAIKNREQALVRNLEKIPNKIYDSMMNRVSYEISSITQKLQNEAKNLAIGTATSIASKISIKKVKKLQDNLKEQWKQLTKKQQKKKKKEAKKQKQPIKTQKMDGLVEQANTPSNFQTPDTYSVLIGPKNYDNASEQGYDGFNYSLFITTQDSEGKEIPYPPHTVQVTKNVSDGSGTKSVTEISVGASKEKMQKQQDTLLEAIKNFVEKRTSTFEKKFANDPHYEWYFSHKKDPLGLLNPKIRRSQPISIWKGKEYQIKINDPLSFQAQSYMHDIFTKSSTGEWSKQTINNIQYEYTDGNIINFWIEDVNNGKIMTTPAFLTDIRDDGGKGQWDQFTYVGAQYPKYTYKGSEKRVISFELKIGCFDYQYFPQYLKKLNFLRGVGFPTYTEIMMGTNNYTRSITFPKAPIYKLTLGSIVNDQYGFFQDCSFQWPDDEVVWNLSDFKNTKYGIGHALKSDYINKAVGAITSSIEIPIVTTIKCQFVCLYGKGPSNDTQFYGEIPFKDKYQQISISQPISINTDENIQPTQPSPEQVSGETYQNNQDTNPGEI